MTRNLIQTVALAIAAGLAGCTPHAAQYEGPASTARNTVSMIRLTHAVTPDGAGVDESGRNAILRFLAENAVGYGDTLSLVSADPFPQSAAQDIGDILRRQGLALDLPQDSAGVPAPARGQAVLVVERYTVSPPRCPTTTLQPIRNYANAPSPHFGCANTINLGQMVANPRHLLSGETDTRPVTAKATQAIRLWRNVEPEIVRPVDANRSSTTGSGGGAGGN